MADGKKKEATAPAPAATAPAATAPAPAYADAQIGTSDEDEDNSKNTASVNRYNKRGNYVGRGVIVGDNRYGKIVSDNINVAAGGTVNIERTGEQGSDTTGLQKPTHHPGHARIDNTTSVSSGGSHKLSSKQTTGIIIGVFVLIIIIILVVMFATRCFGSSDTAVNSSEDATNNPSGSNDGASNDTTNNPSGSNDGASNDTTNNPSGSNESGNQKETT